MATILEAIKGINAYPIPFRAIAEIAIERGVDINEEATDESLNSKKYKLSVADILLWLSQAPNISQGGQSYSFSDEQRAHFRRRANAIYGDLGEDSSITRPTFGYKGNRL